MSFIIVLSFSIILQLSAAVIALWLIKVTGHRFAWTAIATAIFLMVLRRAVTFTRYLTGDIGYFPDMAAELIALLISILMVAGIAGIAPVFRSIQRTNMELRKSEHRLRNAQHIALLGFWEWDLRSNTVYLSEETYRLFGIQQEELEGNFDRFFTLVHPEDRQKLQESLEISIQKDFAFNSDFRVTLPNGEERFVQARAEVVRDKSGLPLRMNGIVLDITHRKLAEAMVVQAEKRYRNLFEQAPVKALVIRNCDGEPVIEDCNQRFLSSLGYTLEEVLEQPLANYYTEKSYTKLIKGLCYNLSRGGDVTQQECELTTRDGRIISTLVSAVPLTDSGGGFSGALMMHVDITERKAAENELRKSRARFAGILDIAEEAIISVDEEQKIIIFNKGAEHIFGYSSKEVLGRPLNILLPERYRTVHPKHVADFSASSAVSRRMEERGEIFGRRKNGEEFIAEASISKLKMDGEVIFTVVLRDITAHKQAVDDLKKFKSISDKANYGTLIADLDGILLYVNEALAEMHGFIPAEVAGKHLSVFYSPEKVEDCFNLIKTIKNKGGINAEEIWHIRKDGVIFPVLMSASMIADESGSPMVFSATVIDITERKAMEDQSAQLEAQLRQAQKLETIGTLAGGIAHDFNNILTPIIGYTDMAITSVDADSQAHADLQRVLKAAHRAKELVQQILTFSRREEENFSHVKIHLIIEESLKLLEASLPATIKLRKNIRSIDETVLANPTQLQQVIMNLCTNAYHAMREHGGVLEVSLELTRIDAEFAYLHPRLHEGEYVQLTVRDTGCGIDEKTKERIFEPFFTTKKIGEGTGLGLSVVHGIVVNHNGEIVVESKPGEGTTFRIFFPVSAGDTDAESSEGAFKLDGEGHVLIVDDDEEIVSMGKQMLEYFGYQVTTKTDGTEALDVFREAPDKFDLVITDQTMPDITGVEIARKLLTIRSDIPIILMTGFSEMVTPESAKTMGIHEFILKPIVLNDLGRAIQRALKKRGRRKT